MKNLTLVLVILFSLTVSSNVFSQNVGINSTGSDPDASAMLDISSTDKGFLLPRMTTTEQNAIALPATGLTIFNTSTNNIMINTGTSVSPVWTALVSGTIDTTSIANFSSKVRSLLSATAPITYSNGAIGITQATTSTNGYLTSTDWNTFNNKASAANTWEITGNSAINPVSNFLGTIDNKSLRVRTNNVQRMKVDSLGNVAIGQDNFDATNPERLVVNAGVTTSVNALVAKGSIDSYLQFNIKNQSTGTNATTDIVATADNGTETTNYVDLGINGSNYTGSAIQTGVANDGYLISAAKDFYLVNSTPNKSILFLTGGTGVANERMRILSNGRVGMGVQDPTAPFVVKDTMEVRRVGSLSQLLFTNTAGTGDFRIGGDGGDIYWQGGGGRNLQMGSYWTTILGGDRQSSTYPAFVSLSGGTGVLVQSQRNASIPLGIQAFSGSQTGNLTEWRNSSGTVLSAVDNSGYFGIGKSTPTEKLDVTGNVRFSGALMPNNSAGTSGYVLTSNGAGSAPTWATAASSGWSLTGNASTTGSNFIGTTDSKELYFKTANTQAMMIDVDGNVGIGASPSFIGGSDNEKLLVDAGSTGSHTVINATGTINDYLQTNVQNNSNGNKASSDIVATANNGSLSTVYIDMGINSQGYSNAASNILNGSNTAYLYATGDDFYVGNGATGKDLIFFTNNSGVTGTNGTERARITSAAFQPGANNTYSLGTTARKWTAVYATNGTIQTSDRRLKTNIKNLNYGLKEIMALNPVRYNWKTNPNADNKIGLIAQDVRKLIPEVVVGDESKENIGMNYAELVPVLVNAIKEQQHQIDDLKKEVELMRNKK